MGMGGTEVRTDMSSDAAGDMPVWLPYAEDGSVGEFACDDGFARGLGDITGCFGRMGGGSCVGPPSTLGARFADARLEVDRRDWWCRFIIALCIGGVGTMFWGT